MEKIVKTKFCKHCGESFDITDKDLEFYEKVSPVFPNPGVSFSTPGLKQAFPPREKGVEENIPLDGGGTKGGAVIPAEAGIYQNEKRSSNHSETSSEGQFSGQRPVSFKETGLKKYLIPPPTLCPDCRQQRRLSFRNERKLYKRKCDASGKEIISIYSPDKPYKVYNQDFWWSDGWDALDYGRDFDFSKSFFEQFHELDFIFPKISTTIQNSENCAYTNDTGDSSNCYMSFRTHYSKNITHSYRANRSNDCIDCYQVKESENLYECFQCNKCQNSSYLYKCNSSHSSLFLWNCSGCNNCIFCWNLNNAQYSILNKIYNKEEYKEKKKEIENNRSLLNQMKNQFFELIKGKIVHKDLDNTLSIKSLGNELIECNDCYHCYMMKKCEGSRYAWDNVGYKNSMDNYSGGDSSFCYETLANKKSYKNNFSYRIKESENLFYSMFMFTCKDCFGCIGLKNKSYCILNKQYTKEEYEILVPKIIEHMMTPPKSPSIERESGAIVKQGEQEWGEFFPSSLSPFGYNETVAQEYYPINTPPIPHPIPQKEKGNNSCLFSFSLGGKDAGKADRGTFNW
ncbi:hypothetical protein HGA92_06015, partial [Candidatus Gracilibacteria bacterium]|nr:hypothetical protein [Candidatus Gracilibacteria bacterium]